MLEADEAWSDPTSVAHLKGLFLSRSPRPGSCALRLRPVLTMSSGGAARAHRGMVASHASKGGIEALTRALALTSPCRIRVVGLVPGLIVPGRQESPPEALAKTDATVPLGRAGIPADLAGPAVFLASDDAAYVTGSFVTVDGGVLFQQRSPQVETFPLERFPGVR